MNNAASAQRPTSALDVQRLAGCVVLVKSTRDRRNPPTALRGSIEVQANAGAAPDVSIAVEFPQMFTTAAHHRTIPLDAAAVERLLASEYNGTFEFTIDEELG